MASDPLGLASSISHFVGLQPCPAHLVFLSFITYKTRLKRKQFLYHAVCSQHVVNAPGCQYPAPSPAHVKYPGFCLSVPSSWGNQEEGLGVFQAPRTTLYFPPKDLQAAFWAGVESSLCRVSASGGASAERGLPARPTDPLALQFLRI